MLHGRRVAVLGGVRIPFCRQNTAYADVGNLGMSVRTLGALVEKFGLHGQQLGEVAMGAVIKHSSDWNLGREATLSSGLSALTPGITLQRACGTSLDSIITIGNKIATGQIEAGKVKAFAVTSSKRLTTPALKNLPTLDEAGLKGFNVNIWHGVYAPKGTPKAVTDRLNTALRAALKDPDFISAGRVADAITDPDKTSTIGQLIGEGAYYGMQTFDAHLVALIRDGIISLEAAMSASTSPHDLTVELRRLGLVA